MIACVAVTVKDAHRQVGVRIFGLALYGDRERDRHGDRSTLANRDGVVVGSSSPESDSIIDDIIQE